MRRALIVVALLAVAAFVAWQWYDRSYAPVRHYERFAEEILRRHYGVAATMCDGLSEADLARAGTQEKTGPGPEMFQTLFPSRFAIESRDTAADGTLTLHATQTVLFNPAGVESVTRPAMYATLRQTTKLRKTSGAWKVTAFENEFVKMDALTAR
jgi:hypothetical protein